MNTNPLLMSADIFSLYLMLHQHKLQMADALVPVVWFLMETD